MCDAGAADGQAVRGHVGGRGLGARPAFETGRRTHGFDFSQGHRAPHLHVVAPTWARAQPPLQQAPWKVVFRMASLLATRHRGRIVASYLLPLPSRTPSAPVRRREIDNSGRALLRRMCALGAGACAAQGAQAQAGPAGWAPAGGALPRRRSPASAAAWPRLVTANLANPSLRRTIFPVSRPQPAGKTPKSPARKRDSTAPCTRRRSVRMPLRNCLGEGGTE